KIGVAYIDHVALGMKNMPGMNDDGSIGMDHITNHKTSMIAGQYNIGGMGLHLGYGQSKWDTDSMAGEWIADKDTKPINPLTGVAYADNNDPAAAAYDGGLKGGALLEKKKKTTFFGVSGGLADTGVSFFLQVRSNKVDKKMVTKSWHDHVTAFNALAQNGTAAATDDFSGKALRALQNKYIEDNDLVQVAKNAEGTIPAQTDNDAPIGTIAAVASDNAAQRKRGMSTSSDKKTPWVVGLSRSLGGGASVIFEHANDDDDSTKNTTGLWLKVDF
ncbi:MAG: hypothetical protein OXI60_05100, partial [Acidiferrobacterales bacterium]|nr:hypothetical protein [Acidiferrobacterales bacterium]